MNKHLKEYISNMLRWATSYEKNGYGELFFNLIKTYQPEKVVELGTKRGFSAYHIAKGLTHNKKGTLDCYDLWEDYNLNPDLTSAFITTPQKNLKKFKNIVTLNQGDAIGVEKKYDQIDILHIDLDNCGDVLEKVIPPWIDKVRQLIIIEGGSPERDGVDWMVRYRKQPIGEWLKRFAGKRNDIQYFTIDAFPSLTLIRKK